MTTQELLEALTPHPDKPLVFEANGQRVPPGYHVTEVMHVTYESMDCGGQAYFWQETLVQLMGPGPGDKPEFMAVGKFLRIYEQVAASLPVRGQATIRFEYAEAAQPAIHYHVGQIALEGGYLVVRLAPPGVTCKARGGDSVCCAPLALELAHSTGSRCC
mgnify:CR=1 FL=1